ncbi:MAG: class I adenylate-forming enzyme family protein [Ignavibacteriaceae bacterium]|nr:class I adenylate-forming enzyme family protein [Ignavibacteriaceae bacterium]
MFQPRLLHNFLIDTAEKYNSKEALVFGSHRMTYGELNDRSTQFANSLIELGIQRHDRVIIFLDNSIESIISIWGILKTGAVFIVLNGSIKPNKLEYIIKDSGATIIIADLQKYDVVNSALLNKINGIKVILVGANFADISVSISNFYFEDLISQQNISLSKKLSIQFDKIIDYDLATLIYTSGSTGEPKGVISSHFNMISAARSIIEYLENDNNDIILEVLPLSFDYGLYQMLMSTMFGGTLILETSFMFPIKIIELIENEKVTGFPIVPTIISLLLKMKDIENYKLNSLRYISNTGAAFPVPHIQKFNKIFPHIKIYSMFGLTECKRIAYLPPEEISKRPASVGKAIPNCEVFIMDESGKEVSAGEVGELVVRGSNVMRGYWNAPELTEKVYRKGIYQGETLLYTGDLFRKDDDGFLYFLGRKDDMIKSKGERISPKEIENILCSINGVAESAVIGVPDEILGQAIKAFIVIKDGWKIETNDILFYCSKNMESFMVPKHIEFVKELPKSPNGKIDKKILKQELLNQ